MDTTAKKLVDESGAGESRRGVLMSLAMKVATSEVGGGAGGASGGGSGELASPKLRRLICPFCGALTADSGRCGSCHARFDPLSRQASQNEMGPWFVRDETMPHRPGCNYTTIKRLVETGGIEANSVLRGPSTRQFWMLAKHTPGVGQLFGVCHNCGSEVAKDAFSCGKCHEVFSTDRDRQHLGLGPSRPLPGRAAVEVLAMRAEPPAGAELVAGPAAIPLAPQESRGRVSGGRRVQDGSASGGEGLSGEEGLDAIKQIDELKRAVRSLRQAWMNERQRAWVSVACAGGITVLAMAVLLLS